MTVNADGTRLASGGLDGNVKIWDTSTIVQFKDRPTAADESLCRPLCSMSRHNGVVTSVKFSPDGRFLASGSDDKIVLIWEREEGHRPTLFGDLEEDLEHWTVRKRLVAHDNDIQDICWLPDGLLLVTVGLDRSVIIWLGVTFERIKRYDIHQSMVKGIVFDPASKFFATASDDRTVRVFRYYRKLTETSLNNYEFQMEHIILDPFRKSPLTSYFRRMSWSPDGQHIAVPNATNGPVSSVAIISRGNWGTDVSLIGHEAPCEVCLFSPRLFRSADQVKDNSFSTVLATGGQDRALAIWLTSRTRPLLVAEDIVTKSISDICWTPDGHQLYLSAQDGSIVCVVFEKGELGETVSEDQVMEELHRYGADRESTVFAESTEQLELEARAAKKSFEVVRKPETTGPEPVLVKAKQVAPKVTKLNNLVVMKNGKKRVAPTLVSSLTVPQEPLIQAPTKKFKVNTKLSQSSYFLPRLGVQSAVHGLRPRPTGENQNDNEDNEDNDNEDMGIDVDAQAQNVSGATLRKKKNKLKRSVLEARYPNPFKLVSSLPETLFHNKAVLNHEVGRIFNSGLDLITSLDSIDENLMFQVIVNGIEHIDTATGAGATSLVEVRNGPQWTEKDDELVEESDRIDFQDPTVVTVSNNEQGSYKTFALYFPFKIQHVLPVLFDGILTYFVLISFSGSIQIVLAESGNYCCPTLELATNVVFAKHRDNHLVVLTSAGLVYSWYLPNKYGRIRGVLRGVLIAAILNGNNVIPVPTNKKEVPVVVSHTVRTIDIDRGCPVVVLEQDHSVFRYSVDLQCWTKVVDSWAFLAVSDSDIEGEEPLVKRNYAMYKDDLRRVQATGYTWTSKNTELQRVMLQRLQERPVA